MIQENIDLRNQKRIIEDEKSLESEEEEKCNDKPIEGTFYDF